MPTYSFEKTVYPTDFDLNQLLNGQLQPKAAPVDNNISNFISISSWKRTVLPNLPPGAAKLNFLLFAGDEQFSSILKDQLLSLQHTVIEARHNEDLLQLWARLHASGVAIDHIIYCVSLDQQVLPVQYEVIEERLDKGYLGLSALAASIANSRQLQPIPITVIANQLASVTAQDSVDPLKSTILAPAKIIPSEISNLSCKVIDIPYPFTQETEVQAYASQVLNELFYDTGEPLVAYRFHERWVQYFDALPEGVQTSSNVRIVDKGVYIVTGGFGGMGFSIASDLVHKHNANVVLLYRSDLSGRKEYMQQLQEMRATGCQVDLFQVDLSSEDQVQNFLLGIKIKYPVINGLIWAAGEVDHGGIIQNRERVAFLQYLRSKVHGLLLFEKYCDFRELDFIALFSSIGNAFYHIKFGQVAYNAANEFMEHYAYYLRRKTGVHAFAINWCDWMDVGMTVKTNMNKLKTDDINAINANILHGIYPGEGVKIFQRCLQSKSPVTTIYRGDLHAAIRSHRAQYEEINKALRAPAAIATEVVSNETDLRETLLELYGRFFGKEDIHVKDDFFELGGDSLKAMTLVARINKKLGVNLAITDIYRCPTIEELLPELAAHTADANAHAIPKAPAKQFYPLSSEQLGMYFLQVFDKQSTAYNENEVIWVNGRLDKQKLESVFIELIRRHESLRTIFVLDEDVPKQVIVEDFTFSVEHLEYKENLNEILQSFIRPFDLTKAPLYRVGLIEVSPEEHIIIMDSHHIVMDGPSKHILMEDFKALYNGAQLPPLKLQYKDYADWQQSAKQQAVIAAQKQFWKNIYEEELPVLELPTDFPRPVIQGRTGDFVTCTIDAAQTAKLKAIASAEGTTLFTVLFSLCNVLVARLGNQEDIVMGTPVSARRHEDLERVAGMFVNSLALRNYPKGNMKFIDFLRDVKTRTLAYLDNMYYPLDELIDELKIDRDTSRNPLFDTMFIFQSGRTSQHEIPGLTFRADKSRHTTSKFDLAFSAIETQTDIAVSFVYSKALFKRETVERFTHYFNRIVSAITNDQEKELAAIDIMSDGERRQLLVEFNNTAVAYDEDLTVADLFLEQVRKVPDRIALVYEGRQVTYRQLNNMANTIAHKIVQKLPGTGHRIGMLFSQTVEMVASMLAITKTGNAYVPLSPETPDERNNYILSNCEAELVLVQRSLYEEKYAKVLDIDKKNIIVIDEDESASEIRFTPRKVSKNDIVYIIYTSGTTGTPKGVEVMHRGLTNYVLWAIDSYKLTPDDATLQLVSYHFDGAGSNTYPALHSGGKLVLVKRERRLDSAHIIDVMRRERITYAALLPALYNALLDEFSRTSPDNYLRVIMLAGEKASRDMVKRSRSMFPQLELRNHYGPTETTIGSADNAHLLPDNTSVIGRPIANTMIYVVGKNNEILPPGIRGEICIAGHGVAKGYIKNETLTAQKFISNPFAAGERMYKTGDQGRWLPDGTVEIVGRIDEQIKIRGFRVELSDIQIHLNGHNKIKNSVVIAREWEGEKHLVAYYVADREIKVAELRNHLLGRLPEYMVPYHFVFMEKLPVTQTGKVDKKALPAPEMRAGIEYVAPATPGEKLLAEIWTKVLGVENIGITDNFFSAGGDSIKSIQISSRMRTAGYEVSVKDIFTNQTIRELALVLKEIETVSDQSPVTGPVALSPVQHWFFEKNRLQNHFNQSVILNFPNGITIETLRTIFEKIQGHHDALRLVFATDAEGRIAQYNRGPDMPVSIEEHRIEDAAQLLSVCTGMQASMDLANGPLMKLGLFHMQDGSRLVIIAHHLVIDGVSWRILFEDIEILCRQWMNNEPLSLPLKTDSYQTWTRLLHDYTGSKNFQRAREYWETALQKTAPVILRDKPAGSNTYGERKVQSFRLNSALTSKLLTEVHASFNTQINDILLTALLLAVKKQYGHDSVMIDLEGHGREELHTRMNISRTVGWFTSIYPVLLEKKADKLSVIIRYVKETLRKVPNNGIDYLLLKYYCSDNVFIREAGEPAISFNYLGQFDADTSGNTYRIAGESTGDDVSPAKVRDYDWDVAGIVTGGELEMKLTYSAQQYHDETINTLLGFYKEQLEEIITYCCNYGKVELSPSDLTYSHLTIKDLSITQLDDLQLQYDLEDVYPLSPMQEGMLFHSVLDPQSNNYFEQMTFEMHGVLDVAAIEKSVNDLVARYDILRTVFVQQGYKRPLQVVLKQRKADFTYRDVREECVQQPKDAVIRAWQIRDRSMHFDLEKGVLMRLKVLRVADQEYVFIWSHHHILMDGWCMAILLKEFKEIYARNKRALPVELPPVPPYSSYIKWLQYLDRDESVSFWKRYLDNYETLVGLPRKATSDASFELVSQKLVIGRELTRALQKISVEYGVTLNTIMQAVWGIMLGKYNNVHDVVFGVVVSGRPVEIPGIETMVGLFINTVPVRLQLDPAESMSDLLLKTQRSALETERYQYHPLSEIQALSGLGRELLDHIMIFENYPVAEAIAQDDESEEKPDYVIRNVRAFEQTNYDLTLVVVPGEEMHVRFEYNARRYMADTIQRAAAILHEVIIQLAADTTIRLRDVEIITAAEKHQLLYEFNNTAAPYERHKTIPELFEEQAARTPQAVAMVYQDEEVTYAALQSRSARIAQLLANLGTGPEVRVAVLMERSPHMICGMLGILKAGGSYIPIDVNWPRNRVSEILNSLGVQYVLVSRKSLTQFHDQVWSVPTLCNIICLDADEQHIPAEIVKRNEVSTLWDFVSERADDFISEANFFSSYTGEKFSETEVLEYRNRIVELAKPHLNSNSKVLEIGCGSGLIMYELAPQVAAYTGIDPSAATQEKNRKRLEEKGIKNIELVTGFADDIAVLDEKFDCIILASTVQFFPGYFYLHQVVQDALRLLNDDGVIIIADVYDLRQKETLITSVIEHRAKNNVKGPVDADKDLYFDEDYFRDLLHDHPAIGKVEILHRTEWSNNELFYRFDVLITKQGIFNQRRNGYAKRKEYFTNWHIDRSEPVAAIRPASADNVAYIIFTSGSTGVPNGVVVQHRPVINLIEWVNKTYSINSGDRLLFVTSISFDLSVYDIFGILAAGASIQIASEEELKEPRALANYLFNKKITFWDSAPAALQLLTPLFDEFTVNANTALRLVFLSGDWIPLKLPGRLKASFPQVEVISLGGATEATVWSNYFPVKEVDADWNSIPYGKPIQNARYYIFDANMKVCPVGVPGDLYIGGECLSAGYINNPELTAYKYISNPYSNDPAEIIYRTGDIARHKPDGNMEFLGRVDSQVKIRGFRIELGEIESQLLSYEQVKEVIVMPREQDGDKHLVAYYVAAEEISQRLLREYLSARLPRYMVPSYYVHLQAFPVTANGKLNRKALPEPEIEISEDHVQASTEIQTRLVDIWAEVLKIDRQHIGVRTNFFELGGHSLKLMMLCRMVNDEFKCNISVADMFRLPTISDIEDHLLKGDQQNNRIEAIIGKAQSEADENLKLVEGLFSI
ncbi:MAG TPA: amino acid adenylation domain-containing protein [Chitinophagaceae bacterium]|nr:amino acid adenylation domain-containing protein [Chitinophagaceae bacterium]